MKLKIFTVFDQAAKAYLQPFFMQTTGQALRSFVEVVNSPDHMFGKYPDDYTLFEVGEYDDQTAEIQSHATPVSLGKALEYLKSKPKTYSEEMQGSKEPHYLKPGYPEKTGISIKEEKCVQ